MSLLRTSLQLSQTAQAAAIYHPIKTIIITIIITVFFFFVIITSLKLLHQKTLSKRTKATLDRKEHLTGCYSKHSITYSLGTGLYTMNCNMLETTVKMAIV